MDADSARASVSFQRSVLLQSYEVFVCDLWKEQSLPFSIAPTEFDRDPLAFNVHFPLAALRFRQKTFKPARVFPIS